MKPRISVVICAFNAENRIVHLLESLAAQHYPKDCFEIILVDNASTDNTANVARSFFSGHPKIRFMLTKEPTPGKSRALNKGVARASGKLLVFCDDDMTFLPDWLLEFEKGFKNTGADGLGGRIIARWKTFPAPWWTPAVSRFSPVHDWGDSFLTYSPVHALPVGANMAIRRQVFETIGGFDTRFGHIKGRFVGGEESDLFFRMYKAGMEVVYWPGAKGYHLMDGKIWTRCYLFKRAFVQGRVAACFLHDLPDRFLLERVFEHAKTFSLSGRNISYFVAKMCLYSGYAYGQVFGLTGR